MEVELIAAVPGRRRRRPLLKVATPIFRARRQRSLFRVLGPPDDPVPDKSHQNNGLVRSELPEGGLLADSFPNTFSKVISYPLGQPSGKKWWIWPRIFTQNKAKKYMYVMNDDDPPYLDEVTTGSSCEEGPLLAGFRTWRCS